MSTAQDFAASVRQLLDKHWSLEKLRAGAGIGEVRDAAVAVGWLDLTGDEAVASLLAASSELGAAACPVWMADAFAAQTILPEDLAAQVREGSLPIAVVAGSSRLTEADVVAALVLDGECASLHPVISRRKVPGVARPDWSEVELGPAMWTGTPGHAKVDRALTLMRLALAARATGAASRLHRLSVEHACARVQFGKPIGSFGAVQQRAAACEIDATACALLLSSAAQALDRGDADGELASELAYTFVADASRRVLLGAHHTLAAVGYFEEHIGPWLFRRVHADLGMAASLQTSAGGVGDRLIEAGGSLPSFVVDDASTAFRGDVRELVAALRDGGEADAFDRDRCIDALVERGWIGMGWPVAAGGRAATLGEQVALHEELAYARMPVEIELASEMLLGNAILAHGSAEQCNRFLPVIRQGGLRFCLGYSEPETGSDLAGLRTRAERQPEGWLVNGQKIWTTRADQADYIWLAARTSSDARPRHAGISVFLVPMDTPGITVVPMTALSGERSATVFLDDVVVPDEARVGEVDGGWSVITHALAGERVLMGGIAAQLHRVLDDVLADVRARPDLAGPRGSHTRAVLGRLAAELHALRALVADAVGADGIEAFIAAPKAGVFGGELAESFSEALVDLFGNQALIADRSAIAGGRIEHLLRLSVMYVVGGGTNDIQRGLIARALGLPR